MIPYEYVSYVVVSKSSIKYSEQIVQISVNGKYALKDEIFIDEDGQPNVKEEEATHYYITHNTKATLPENPTSWVIKKGSSLENSYGLEYYNKHSETVYRVVLYLPNEPECDFMITEKEIKNGNLYITVEAYTEYTNEYLNKNDVKFYDLYVQDTSELVDNFDVYVLVKTIK